MKITPEKSTEPLDKLAVARLVRNYFEHYCSQISLREDGSVAFVLYGAFAFSATPDSYGSGNNWGLGLLITDSVVATDFLGESATILSSEQQIVTALKSIDAYVRLRLGSEYVAAFEASTRDRTDV